MEVVELRFLLILLGFPPDYRAPLANVRPTEKLPDRNRACRQLRDRGLVDCSEEILRYKASPAGKSLLKLDATQLPVSDLDILALKAGAQETITPGQALKSIADHERQTILMSLAGRGLIQAETRVKDVWLTEAGQLFLQYECMPQGNPTVSLNLLANYLAFMRRSYAQAIKQETPLQAIRWKKSTKPTDADVLHLICTLDNELGTENYLPIYHLRHSLQPPMSRNELDQALYRLQRSDRIDLSSLQEAIAYESEQVEAGIPQDIGGPLFFITVLNAA